MADPGIVDQVNLNTAQLNYNISRLNSLLSEDGSTGTISELDAALIQSVTDINEWVAALEILLNDKHQQQEDSLDLLVIRSISNTARLDVLYAESGVGIIKDIYDELLQADISIRALIGDYKAVNDARVALCEDRISALELAHTKVLTLTDLDNINTSITLIETNLLTQMGILNGVFTDLTDDLQDQIDGTVDEISLALIRIHTLDTDTSTHISEIKATASSIVLSVDSLRTYTDGEFSEQSSSISILDSSITSAVSRLDYLLTEDGSIGLIKELQSSITQTAEAIAFEVTARENLASGMVATNTAHISLTAEAIVSAVTAVDGISGRMGSAEQRITSTEITSTVISENLDSTNQHLGSTLTQLANRYGLIIKETTNGISYAAGFGMVLHPEWQISSEEEESTYVIGNTVTYTNGLIYESILDHTATEFNSPGSAEAGSYWELLPDGMKSEFVINADQFAVTTPEGTSQVFSVSTETGEVSILGSLVVYGSISDRPTSLIDINQEEYDTLLAATGNEVFFQNTEPANGVEGDFWLDTDDSRVYLHNGTGWVASKSDGLDGISIIWQGEFTDPPADPQDGWAYKNTTVGKSFVYQDGAWYQMTIDGTDGQGGQDGLSIVWKGELTEAPIDPELNWAYRDTDNNKVYIYNGSAWELMVVDGDDGIDGAPGEDGLSVFITYHNNGIEDEPGIPTGTGVTDGWHTEATSAANWMSQKIASDAASGDWGAPIRIKGDIGITGPSGADGVDGTDAAPCIWIGEFASHPENPENGWSYKNTTLKKTFIYQDSTWYQMTIDGTDGQDGTDGFSIVWKGDLASAPSSPAINWAYRDTDNGRVFIYNGTAWELMVLDGNDGSTGAQGDAGLSVFITYHDNEITSAPTTPIGTGITDGWHTTATGSVNWMSQKVATDEASGDWGTPILIKGQIGDTGASGADGIDGTHGAPCIWKGEFATAPADPENGWSYRNTTQGKSYTYQDGTWYQMTIDGIDGQNGTDGLDIVWKGDLASAPSNPVKNWAYRDTDNNRVYIYDGIAWELMVVDGADGVDGATGTDGQSVYITYNDASYGANLSDIPADGNGSGWHTSTSAASNWMAQKISDDPSSGTWGPPIWIRGIDGTNGEDGADGLDGDNIVWKGSYSSAPSYPQNLWAYYNTSSKASYVYSEGAWRQMAVDGTAGVPGISIAWKGSSSAPPSSPQINWAYYDTDNGYAYIYNGYGWEVLAKDGLDGYNGTNGYNGSDGTNGTNGYNGTNGSDGVDGSSTFTYYQTNTPSGASINELWFSSTTRLLKRWSGSSWITVGNSYDNTSQLTDGASLGLKANWGTITGTGKPANYADQTQAALNAGANVSAAKANGHTLIQGGYINTGIIHVGSAQIDNLSVTNAKIANLQVGTTKIADYAVSSNVSAYVAGQHMVSTTEANAVVMYLPSATAGDTISLWFSCVVTSGTNNNPGFSLRLYSNGAGLEHATAYRSDHAGFAVTFASPITGTLGIQVNTVSNPKNQTYTAYAGISNMCLLALITRK